MTYQDTYNLFVYLHCWQAADNLKSVCKELELQVIDYEGIIKQYEQKESDWNTLRYLFHFNF